MKNITENSLEKITQEILQEEEILRKGGGDAGIKRQRNLGRLTARERIEKLVDNPSEILELGIWAGYKMYEEWGEIPAAGLIAVIATVSNRTCMIIANDATVKAGAFFPQTVKKMLRMQKISNECQLPILYLVDSSGVFLPLQDEIFPDEDDFGRIFRNNSILSAHGIPQIAAIMGNCIAGGSYLPALCDTIVMTEGSGLYLAGPHLVRAAIGQVVDTEELGGADMHSMISGTIDFKEPNDEACIKRLRTLVELLPGDPQVLDFFSPCKDPSTLYTLVGGDSQKEYDVHELLDCIVDKDTFQEYKKEYGMTLVTGFAKLNNQPIGIVASQRAHVQSHRHGLEIGGVIYAESADKAANFILDCNQMKIPLVFFQDVSGFMVGKSAEESGIIRSGAKLVKAVSNSTLPKITIIVGNSFGAGHYALCGKAFDPQFIFAWPSAKYAVMGKAQASSTLSSIQKKVENTETLLRYEKQTDIRYGAARGWVDAIIPPHLTRSILVTLLPLVMRGGIKTCKRV